MPSTTIIEHKRGDTFSRAGFLPADSLTAGVWTARCSAIEKFTNVKHALAVTLIAPAGDETRYLLHIYAGAAAVALWRVGKLDCDVEFTDSSALPEPFVITSKTFTINLKKDETT